MKPGEGVALGGRYRLVSRIAVGGMGEVWRAHDESLARDVAVKVLREEYAGDEGFLERFRTEARNCAQLSHPNIAQLFDYGEQAGSAFLVMELILGEPLSDLLDREPVLPTRRLLPILAETARALHAAHVAGVVHRDVKPGNILLSRAGRVKITDFGISTATGRIPMTDSGMVMGTAQYLSPEQAIGKAATAQSDIYALGIVAYEALVGHRPFTGATSVDIAVAHVNTPVPPMPSDVDPELAALVMRMLAKDPEDRPRSAASLARVLDDMAVRTSGGVVPSELGRHARPVDVVDAVTTGSLAMDSFPMVAQPRRPSGQPARPTPAHDEPAAEPPATTPASSRSASRHTPRSTPPPAPPLAAARPAVAPSALSAPSGASVGSAASAASAGSSASPAASSASAPWAFPGRSPQVDLLSSATDLATRLGGDIARGSRRAAGWSSRTARRWWRVACLWLGAPLPETSAGGRWWGRLSWPLVVLVLMVLFALLGAAFADSLWGRSRSAPPSDDAGSQILVLGSHESVVARGIIDKHPEWVDMTARDH